VVGGAAVVVVARGTQKPLSLHVPPGQSIPTGKAKQVSFGHTTHGGSPLQQLSPHSNCPAEHPVAEVVVVGSTVVVVAGAASVVVVGAPVVVVGGGSLH
jgi:hypothetical protein